MDITTIILLIGCGVFVGVVNTFAGAGAIITVTLLMMFGITPASANATNRVAVLFQTITMSVVFFRQGLLDWRLGLRLSIPAILGAITGSELISRANPSIFAWMLIGVLMALMLMLVFNPTKALKGGESVTTPRLLHYIILFGIGIYGGAFHIGVGYMFLAILIMGMGYNLMAANALKGFIVFCYTIFALIVFTINGEVNWSYGLVHGIGNIAGAYLATRYAKYIPVGILRWALMVFIGLTIIYLIYEKI